MPDRSKAREYQARYLEKNREKVKERARQWWRAKHGSVPREEYLAAIKAETARKKSEQTEQKKQAREQRKRDREIKVAPVSPMPTPRPAPAPRPAATARKPGRLLAMAGFVRNW